MRPRHDNGADFSSSQNELLREHYLLASPGAASAGRVGVDTGAADVEPGAEPVVAMGGEFVSAMRGPVVPVDHQMPGAIRTTMMMPMIQRLPLLAERGFGRLFGS